jgi:hypothetical protein
MMIVLTKEIAAMSSRSSRLQRSDYGLNILINIPSWSPGPVIRSGMTAVIGIFGHPENRWDHVLWAGCVLSVIAQVPGAVSPGALDRGRLA